MAYAGIGGLLAVHLHNGFSMDVGFGSTRLLKFELVGVTQGWAIIVAAFVTAGIAVPERGGVRFFSSERRFDGLDGTLFRTVEQAARAARERDRQPRLRAV